MTGKWGTPEERFCAVPKVENGMAALANRATQNFMFHAAINGWSMPIVLPMTHCIHGHPLSGDNLYHRRDGGRMCRECKRAKDRKYQAKKRKPITEREPEVGRCLGCGCYTKGHIGFWCDPCGQMADREAIAI